MEQLIFFIFYAWNERLIKENVKNDLGALERVSHSGTFSPTSLNWVNFIGKDSSIYD